MSLPEYHLLELEIARNPGDPRHVMPPIESHHRRILDLGCGAGQTLIASDLERGVVACGVDVDVRSLALGRQLDRSIHFLCAQGEALPFAPGSFDLVFSRVALPHMHLGMALAEVHRVLATGGTLWATLHPFARGFREFCADIRQLALKSAAFRLFFMANGLLLSTAHRQLPTPFHRNRYESYQTRKGLAGLLARTGFSDVEFPPSRFFVVTARKLNKLPTR